MTRADFDRAERALAAALDDLGEAEDRARPLIVAAVEAAEEGLGAKTRAAFAEALAALEAVAVAEARATAAGVAGPAGGSRAPAERAAAVKRFLGGPGGDPASVAREVLEHMNRERG